MENSNNSTGSRHTGRSILQPSGFGQTYNVYNGGIIGSKEKVMEAFEDYASQAKIINDMILKTGSKELEKEFDKLLDMSNLLTLAHSNKNRQDWINAGFEPVQE